MKIKLTLAVATFAMIGLLPAAAYADTVTFTLTHSSGNVPYLGGSLTYDATVSAPVGNSAPVFLNGDSFNITAPVMLDDTDFFSKFPVSLSPGASFTGDLFVLTVPPNSPLGTFLGTFTLQGGPNGNANNKLGTADFSLNIISPEPSSIVLLLIGMSGLAMTLRWARFKGQSRGWAR